MAYRGEHYQDAKQNETRIARKSYICDRCHKPIEPGESYNRAFGLWFHDTADGCAQAEARSKERQG